MYRKWCNLCQIADAVAIRNLRKYTVTPIFRLKNAEKAVDDVETNGKTELEQNQNENLIIQCRRKQFNFNDQTKYTKFETIPIASSGWASSKSRGDHFTINPIFEEEELDESIEFREATFENLGISPRLAKIAGTLGYQHPTTIQKLAIPEILDGHNTVIQAETGTGKTYAYLLPIVQQVLKWKPLTPERKENSPLALILTPSRELVIQIGTEVKKLTDGMGINVRTLIGGRTKNILRNPPLNEIDIMIGTIGMTSKLTTARVYKLDQIRHTVLDEAHALFDETYEEKLSRFLRKINFGFEQTAEGSEVPISSQLTLVSATMPPSLPEYLDKCINRSSLVPIVTKNVHRILAPQKFFRLGPDQKPVELLKVMKPRAFKKESTLLFCNSTSTCDWMSIFLNEMNIKAVSLHGNMPTPIRRDHFWKFRNGEVNVMCTTNSSARGLDTVTVDCIINYDFPMNTADYIHRCGRIGRIGSKHPGRVINFISRPLEIELTQKIERAARRKRALPIFDIAQQKSDQSADDDIDKLLSASAEN